MNSSKFSKSATNVTERTTPSSSHAATNAPTSTTTASAPEFCGEKKHSKVVTCSWWQRTIIIGQKNTTRPSPHPPCREEAASLLIGILTSKVTAFPLKTKRERGLPWTLLQTEIQPSSKECVTSATSMASLSLMPLWSFPTLTTSKWR